MLLWHHVHILISVTIISTVSSQKSLISIALGYFTKCQFTIGKIWTLRHRRKLEKTLYPPWRSDGNGTVPHQLLDWLDRFYRRHSSRQTVIHLKSLCHSMNWWTLHYHPVKKPNASREFAAIALASAAAAFRFAALALDVTCHWLLHSRTRCLSGRLTLVSLFHSLNIHVCSNDAVMWHGSHDGRCTFGSRFGTTTFILPFASLAWVLRHP